MVLQFAVARGIRIAFLDTKRLPNFESALEFSERAPLFDLTIEDADDGR